MNARQEQKTIRQPLVVVVDDDDESVRESLPDLLKKARIQDSDHLHYPSKR
jgi:FixJ family two-component response regulator